MTFGHEGGAAFNEDQRGGHTDPPAALAIPQQPAGPVTVLDVIQRAVVGGVDPQMLRELIAMKERAEERAAAQAFAEAMAKFQAECGRIQKTGVAEMRSKDPNKPGRRQVYASLEDMESDVIQELLADCGLTVTHHTVETDKVDRVTVVCRVRHGTHFEDTPVCVPITPIQGADATKSYAGAVTTAQRISTRLALRLRFTTKPPPVVATLTDDEAFELLTLVRAREVDVARLLEYAKAPQVTAIPREKFQIIRSMLQKKPPKRGQS